MLREVGTGLGGREAWIEQAQVAGRTWHRAIVGGFADAADAARFCAGLKAGGHDCFVRPLKRS